MKIKFDYLVCIFLILLVSIILFFGNFFRSNYGLSSPGDTYNIFLKVLLIANIIVSFVGLFKKPARAAAIGSLIITIILYLAANYFFFGHGGGIWIDNL